MKININNLTKEELKSLHAFILTLYRYNNFHFVNNMSILKEENNWNVNLNDNTYVNENLNNIIVEVLLDNYNYYQKLLNNNIPSFERQEYINYHSKKSK